MSSFFYVFKKSNEDVERFAADMCKLLHFSELEKRYSSNHANGRYYWARALGIDVTFDNADVSADYIADVGDDFVIAINPQGGVPIGDRGFAEGLTDLIARMIARAGYRVARPLSPRIGSPVLWYRRNEKEDAPYEEWVIVEQRPAPQTDRS